ncbi:MAG: ABC transporter substrate-binding protein [Clostridiales bacterium]|nr:ABC transporter substrate-binding protein [Clostridiales bacterium]
MKRKLAFVMAAVMLATVPAGVVCADEAESASGGNIVIAASSLGSTLNPWDQTDATTSAFQYALYDRLVKYDIITDEDGNLVADTDTLVGSLAESWDTSEDGLTWTFYIDPDATFANGDPVTAQDVIWSFEQCRDNANSSFFFTLTNITEMEATDDSTVVLTLSSKCNMFLRLLEIYSFCIVDQSAAEEAMATDSEYLTTNVCGSGPYELVTYDTTSQVVLQARDDYWDTDALAVNDTVTYLLVQEASDRQMMLEKGDVDVALDLEDKNVQELSEMEGINVEQFASNKHLFLCLNCNIEPFDNELVRQAIAYAIPYDTLVDEIMYGNATVTTSMLPEGVTGHIEDENTHYEQDIEKAKELLAEAGYADGFSCTMTLGNGFTDWEESAVVIQAALAEIGINMTINEIDRATFLTQAAEGNLEIFLNRFNPFIGDPGYLVNCLYTTESSYNYYNYSNEEFDALYEEAEAAATEEERLAIYEEMQYIFAEDCPVVELYTYSFAYCGRDNVEGFAYFPDGTIRFQYLSKTE